MVAGRDRRRPLAVRRPVGSPCGRFTKPEEVATLVCLLASPLSGNVTGANFVIDGGLIKTT
jgi:NAD(P)-dependent dehydrogenase (short-subunit alcohol dehydrogenase family)